MRLNLVCEWNAFFSAALLVLISIERALSNARWSSLYGSKWNEINSIWRSWNYEFPVTELLVARVKRISGIAVATRKFHLTRATRVRLHRHCMFNAAMHPRRSPPAPYQFRSRTTRSLFRSALCRRRSWFFSSHKSLRVLSGKGTRTAFGSFGMRLLRLSRCTLIEYTSHVAITRESLPLRSPRVKIFHSFK